MATHPRRLSFLLAVHRAGGVLAAADVLGVTASAVSQQIARLEAEEGVTVLDRGPRGVTLTPAGRVLAEAAERIEAELVEARQAVAALGDGIAGPVAIGAFQTAIRAIVAPALAPLAEQFPAIEVTVREHEPAESVRRLRSGDLDAVVLERDSEAANLTPRGVRDVPLVDEPWRIVVSAGAAAPERLGDLARLTFVGSEEDTAATRALQRLSGTLGTDLATRHVTYDFDTTLALVAEGQGAALLPALALTPISGALADNVQVVRLPGLGERRLVVRHRATRHEPSPAVRAVINVMCGVAADLTLA